MAVLLLSMLLHTAHLTPTLHIDTFRPSVFPADERALPRYPLLCEPGAHRVTWYYRLEQGETPDRARIHAALTTIAERVNYLFWTNSDHPDKAVIPAWNVDDNCQLVVRYVDNDFEAEYLLQRKILIVENASGVCGRAQFIHDNRPGPENRNNGPSLAWIARWCLNVETTLHEMLHLFGAVQRPAPHHANNRHCSDPHDVLCDGFAYKCAPTLYLIIDCNKDDYFSLRPVPGSYLSQHWNVVNSVFLTTVPKYTVRLSLVWRHDENGEDSQSPDF